MTNWKRFLVAAVVCLAWAAMATAAPRVTVPLDFDWQFHLGEADGANSPNLDDSAWRLLDLPHDWGVEGEYSRDNPAQNGYLPGGVGWYRCAIDVPADWEGKAVRIEFDAVCMNSTVYVNGTAVGGRPYGYISFSCDLTPHLKPGRNVVAVRVDNSNLPSARWYTGAGIYGHVRLVVSHPTHVVRHGTTITTPVVTDERAVVRVVTEVSAADGVQVVNEVTDPAGRVVGSGEGLTCDIEIPRPQLWSPDTPHLYRVTTRLYRGGDLLDEVSEPFGIRTTRWDADTGFWLNGRNVKLRGVGLHWDAGGAIGAAVPDSVVAWRLRQIKEMGCNAVRTGHTPFPPIFYDLCDRIGLMVIDEAFDGWRRKAQFDYGALHFADWWRRDLGEMVRRDRNHPCVIAWSVGNETGERDVHGMRDFVHAIDPTRPVTGGQLLEGVDVAGFTGKGEQPGVLEAFRATHPRVPILLIEETHAYSTRGHYRVVTQWRDEDNKGRRQPLRGYADEEVFAGGDEQWTSSYDNSIVRMTCRQCTKRTNETPWIAGEFKWVGFDYLGEAHSGKRQWPLRYGTPGILDSAGFRKDIFYFYQSQYTTEPMVHLLPDWSLDGRVKRGAVVPVVAYSNCQEVELFKDGQSLGRKRPGELLDFVWSVPWEPGELKAIGYRDGRPAAETAVTTAGPAAKLALSADHAELGARGDMVMVAAEARDAHGRFVPTCGDRVDFAVVGDGGRWVGAENGCPTDVAGGKLPHRDLFAGLVRGYVASTGADGDVELVTAALFRDGQRLTLAVGGIPLRGKPGALAAYYTTDGSEPTAGSKRYDGPFDAAGTVKVLVTRNGAEALRTERRY